MKYIIARKLNTIGCCAYKVKENKVEVFINIALNL